MQPNRYVPIFLSLGTNLGDREAYLRQAIDLLADSEGIVLHRTSSIYETVPVGYTDQALFLNMVVQGETDLTPQQLLQKVLEVELRLGRTREVRWGPRTIDIDILLYNNKQIKEQDLTIPHPRMKERAFVLIPLAELADNLLIPGEERSVVDLLATLPKEGVRLWKSPFSLGVGVLERLEN